MDLDKLTMQLPRVSPCCTTVYLIHCPEQHELMSVSKLAHASHMHRSQYLPKQEELDGVESTREITVILRPSVCGWE